MAAAVAVKYKRYIPKNQCCFVNYTTNLSFLKMLKKNHFNVAMLSSENKFESLGER
jgi:hypothetical protein